MIDVPVDREPPSSSSRLVVPSLSYSSAMRRCVQFLVLLVVLGAGGCFFVTPTPLSWWLFALLYLRGLSITVGFHRYFSHRSFHTGRAVQFCLGWAGTSCLQMGPLWWTAHHRRHHRTSDTPEDPHSPVVDGFWHGFFGWLLHADVLQPDLKAVRDLARYPELVWLDRWPVVPGLLLALSCGVLDGWSGVCYGYCLSTLAVLLLAFSVNAFGHRAGSRRFATADHSRNNLVLGYLAFGDGWHNNHHYYPASSAHGYAWYEWDASYRVIRLLEWLGLVWRVRYWPSGRMPQTAKGVESHHSTKRAAIQARPSATALFSSANRRTSGRPDR